MTEPPFPGHPPRRRWPDVPPGDPVGAPNPSTAQARVLFDELARCGVVHVVVCPGSRSTALAVAADDHPRLRTHVALDERGAAYLAVGVGRATGQPAAVVVTSGTAVANLLPAVVEADHDRVPLLLLTADRPPELHGVGANQTIQQLGIFGSSTRWASDVGVAGTGAEEVARWRWIASRAHGTAVGRPVEVPAVISLDEWQAAGPVHLDVPFREPTVPVADDGRTSASPYGHRLDGRPDDRPWRTGEAEPHVPVDHVMATLEDRLWAVDRGLVVVGGAVPDGVGPLLDVAAALGWPVVAEPHASLEDDRSGPGPTGASAGDGRLVRHATLLLGDRTFLDAHEPRLVLRVGRPTVARETASLLARVGEVVAIDPHGAWVDRDDDRVTVVRGAVAATLDALHELQRRRSDVGRDDAWLAAWRAADDAAHAAVERVLEDTDGPNEPAVAAAVLAGVPGGTPVVVGSSMPIRDVDLVAPRRGGVDVHANRGASGIDGTVATAFGVALGAARPTVAIVGDLTLLHDQTAWLLREDPRGPAVDLVVVVLDNDGGGIFSFLPQRRHVERFERLFGTPHGIDLAHLATLHGLGYAGPDRLGDATAVAEEVRSRLTAGGRHLVHIRTDRDENLALHRRLRDEVATTLADLGG